MKDVKISDTATFNQKLSFAAVESQLYQVSFNFDQQLAEGDYAAHAYLEQDDIKLPYQIAISQNSWVSRFLVAATYTTKTEGPRACKFEELKSDGGAKDCVIQYPYPDRPTSAQMVVTVDYQEPYAGYKFPVTDKITDTGANFIFHPAIESRKLL